MALSFLVSIYIARIFGADSTGKYYLFLSILMGLSVFTKFGLNTTLIKLCAQLNEQSEKGLIRGYWYTAIKVSVTGCALLIVLTLIVDYFKPLASIFDIEDNIVPFLILSLIPITIVSHNAAILIGLNKQNSAVITENAALPFLFLCISITSYLFYTPDENILLTYSASLVIIASVSTYILWRKLRSSDKTIRPDKENLLKTSRPILGINITNYLTDWSATFILAIYGTLQQIGIYNISWRIITILGILLLVFNNLNAPRYSKYYKEGDISKVAETARKTSTILFLIAIPVVIIINLFATEIMKIFGDEFIEGALLLQILTIGQLITFTTGSVGYLLMMSGHEKQLRSLTIYISIIQLTLYLIFIPIYGVLGAAIITTLAISSKNIIAVLLAYKYTGVISLPIPQKWAS